MNDLPQNYSSRRQFLNSTGRFAAVSALAGMAVPHVHAAGSSMIQVALVGCGGRGTGAAANALSTKSGPIKLVAMADVFEKKLAHSYKNLKKQFDQQVDVSDDRKFLGFDGCQKALDCLKPGDIAIFATPPAFRWFHFSQAIKKNLNVFMEKPVTVDGPTTKRMIALGEEAAKKNLKVGVGLMVRHCHGRQQLKERIDAGQIGDIVALRAYRMGGGGGFAGPKPDNISELMYQIRTFHGFLWASGGVYSDFYIHQIDECSWMKGAWPVKAQATGGRHYRGKYIDQNFDNYAVEYTYPDGTKLYYYGRQMPGCYGEFASYAHGSKGAAIISTSAHTPGKVRIFKGQNMTQDEQTWAFPQPEPNPYQLEWDDLVEAIRQDKPYNEVKRGAEASLVTSMGRMAAHTGRIVTFDEILNCPHEFAPDVDKFSLDGPAPLRANAEGKYAVPQPGIVSQQEY
jgi:predicted dehydrogenase